MATSSLDDASDDDRVDDDVTDLEGSAQVVHRARHHGSPL